MGIARSLSYSVPFLLLVACGLWLADETGHPVPDTSLLSAQGRLESITGLSYCMQGDYTVFDPCARSTIWLDSRFSTVPLANYVCQYVSVAGTDVSITCPTIGVQSLDVIDVPYCLGPLLVFDDPLGTWIEWPIRDCASSYDVIRGALPGLTATAGSVDLGLVVCLVNDFVPPGGSNPSTFYGPRDSEVPPIGQAFFYLERATIPSGVTPYGLSSAGEPEVPASGDCAL